MKLRFAFLLLPLLAASLHAQLVPMAVDPDTYAPAHTEKSAVSLVVDKDTGALLVYDLNGGGGGGGSSGPIATDPGFTAFRTTALTSTAQAIKASGGNLYALTLYNVNTVPVFVKFYNTAAGSVTVGTTSVVHVVMVPPGDATTPGMVLLSATATSLKYFSSAIAAAAVTGLADNSTAAPSTAIYVEALYK